MWGSTVCSRGFSCLWVFQAFASIAVVGVALHFIITTISSIKSTLGGVVLIITIIVSKPLWGSTVPHGLFSGLHWVFSGIPGFFSRWFSGFWHFKALTEAAVVIPTVAGVIAAIASIKSALGVVVFVITETVTGPLRNGTLHWSFSCWFRGIKTFTYFAIIVPSFCGIFLATVTTIKLTFLVVVDIITIVIGNPTSIAGAIIYRSYSSGCLGSWFRGIKTFTCVAISVPSFCGIFLATVTAIIITFFSVVDIITIVVTNPTSITISWCFSWSVCRSLGSWSWRWGRWASISTFHVILDPI